MKFVRVPQPRVSSSEACAKTVRTRASAGDAAVQLEGELQTCSSQERQRLLGVLAKDGCKVVIPPDEALAMKADLGLPWNKLRVVRRYVYTPLSSTCNHNVRVTTYRWMKAWDVEIGSEAKDEKGGHSVARR